jgi:hypothetical protein
VLNAGDAVASVPQIIDYANEGVAYEMANGQMNTAEQQIIANIASSIRRGYPQMKTGPNRPERICLVGSGPSLNDTLPELRQLIWEGAILVTLNGAYHWCIEHNLRPQTQIVMDARPSNARFVQPYVPRCNYVIASQCAPETWDAVQGYPDVWIWHPVVKSEGGPTAILNSYYAQQWIGIGGGTTVATRAINLLRTVGYLKFDLFGVDCCWLENQHHAVPQPENDGDVRTRQPLRVAFRDSAASREFVVSAWHMKQLQDFLETFHVNGRLFHVNVHGDGVLAYVMRELGNSPDLSLEGVTLNGRPSV